MRSSSRLRSSKRPALIRASDIYEYHFGALLACLIFLTAFIFIVPVAYILPIPHATEQMILCGLFAACHVMNWPMLSLRWDLWFKGRLSPGAAMLTTSLLMGTFGVPFYILFRILLPM